MKRLLDDPRGTFIQAKFASWTIADQQSRFVRCYHMRLWVLLLVLCTVTNVTAQENLPDLEAVKTRIRETAALIKTLQVDEKSVYRQRDFRGGEEIYELQRFCHWKISATGELRYHARGETLHFQATGAARVPFRVELAYDGTEARSLEYMSRDLDRVFSGKIEDHPTYYSRLPTEFTVLGGRDSLLKTLEKKPYRVVGSEQYLERTVLILEGEPTHRDDRFWSLRILFDMEWGIPVKTSYVLKYQPEDEWIEYAIWSGLEHREVIPGVWLPLQYRKFSFNIQGSDHPKEFSDGNVGTYSNWKVNEDFPPKTFNLSYPDNVPVNDLRPGGDGKLLSKEEIQTLNAQWATP